MYTSEQYVKLFHSPGVWFKSALAFRADPRLTEPFRIIDDMAMRFGEYESYPEELSLVAYHNGF
jgi:hypothetical protein